MNKLNKLFTTENKYKLLNILFFHVVGKCIFVFFAAFLLLMAGATVDPDKFKSKPIPVKYEISNCQVVGEFMECIK